MMEMAVVGTRILCGSVVTPMPAGSLHQSSTGRSTAAPTKMKSAMSSRAVRFNLFKGDCRRTSGSGTMQHYGVPSRLLDWTENPLIAIYFAVEGHKANRAAAVWALDPTWLNRNLRRGIEGVMLHDWSEAQSYLRELEDAFSGVNITAQLPAAIEPPHVDRRLAAQASRFVIFGKTQDLMRTKAARKRRGLRVGMITIPKAAIPSLQEDLVHYGISPATVFPDLTGLCQEICNKWKKR